MKFTSNEFFVLLLFGHLIGDYLTQSHWMALNKKENKIALIAHCFIYTTSVFIFTLFSLKNYNPSIKLFIFWYFGIFFSHVIIDGTNIVDKWLNIIGSRSYENTEKFIAFNYENKRKCQYLVSYTALVQIVADNTLHIIIMYLIYKLLF